MSDIVKVAILGPNERLREGLKRILLDQGFDVSDPVATVDEIVVAPCDNCLLLIDAASLEEGLASCFALRERFERCRNVLMVDDYSIDHVARAFGTGVVDGYVVKAMSCEPLGGALRLIAMGEKIFPSQVMESLNHPVSAMVPAGPVEDPVGCNLSARELDILHCLVEGNPNKVISRRLQIADATVKVHIKAILRKLRVRNRTQAAIWAVSRGMAGAGRSAERALPLPNGAMPVAATAVEPTGQFVIAGR